MKSIILFWFSGLSWDISSTGNIIDYLMIFQATTVWKTILSKLKCPPIQTLTQTPSKLVISSTVPYCHCTVIGLPWRGYWRSNRRRSWRTSSGPWACGRWSPTCKSPGTECIELCNVDWVDNKNFLLICRNRIIIKLIVTYNDIMTIQITRHLDNNWNLDW